MQELQIKHWGHKEVGCIPEDTMQQLILGANGILDIALSLEKEALTLKQQGLCLWNIATNGQACGRMLNILEDIFILPKPAESVAFKQTLQPEQDIPQNLPPEAEEEDPGPSPSQNPASRLVPKRPFPANLLQPPSKSAKSSSASTESDASKPMGKCGELPLDTAIPFLISSEKEITMTGVSLIDMCLGHSSASHHPKAGQIIYQCRECSYITEQKAQVATHMRMYHVHHCLQCRLCSYHTYQSVDFKPHLERKHPGARAKWFEPTPDLTGTVLEEADPDEIPAGIKLNKSELALLETITN